MSKPDPGTTVRVRRGVAHLLAVTKRRKGLDTRGQVIEAGIVALGMLSDEQSDQVCQSVMDKSGAVFKDIS